MYTSKINFTTIAGNAIDKLFISILRATASPQALSLLMSIIKQKQKI